MMAQGGIFFRNNLVLPEPKRQDGSSSPSSPRPLVPDHDDDLAPLSFLPPLAVKAAGHVDPLAGIEDATLVFFSPRQARSRQKAARLLRAVRGPGTEERHSGSVAAADSRALPRIYAPICKDDVKRAVELLHQEWKTAAQHRRECFAEERQKGRQKAVRWRSERERRKRQQEEDARKAEEEEVKRQQEADVGTGENRWKRAFTRLTTTKVEFEFPLEEALAADCGGTSFLDRSSPRAADTRPSTVATIRDPPEEDPGAVTPKISIQDKVVRNLRRRRKVGADLDTHLEVMRKVQKLKNRSIRNAQSHEARKFRYRCLGADERRQFEAAYRRYGPSPDQVCLDPAGLCACLYELGIRGFSTNEQRIVRKLINEFYSSAERAAAQDAAAASTPTALPQPSDQPQQEEQDAEAATPANAVSTTKPVNVGVNLFTFATQLVPCVQKELDMLRHPLVEEGFIRSDTAGYGRITVADCQEIAQQIAQGPLQDTYIAICANQVLQQDTDGGSRNPHEYVAPREPATPASSTGRPVLRRSEHRMSRGVLSIDKLRTIQEHHSEHAQIFCEEVSFLQAQILVGLLCARTQRLRCLQERAVQEEMRLKNDAFFRCRADLLLLKSPFKRYARGAYIWESSGMAKLFLDFGLRSPSAMPSYEKFSNGISFADILELIEETRAEREAENYHQLQSAFESFAADAGAEGEDKQRQGRLDVQSTEGFLRAATMERGAPTQQELQALRTALQDVLAASPRADASLGFGEICRILQRMAESCAREAHTAEVKGALENGFQEAELEELHSIFLAIDADKSGTIDCDEAWDSISNLGFKITRAYFNCEFAQLGGGSGRRGELDFIHFLRLLRLIRDREGIFAANRQINVLEDLLRKERLHVLAYFEKKPVATGGGAGAAATSSSMEDLSDEQLLEQMCAKLNIEPQTSLSDHFSTSTFQELCEVAARMGSFLK